MEKEAGSDIQFQNLHVIKAHWGSRFFFSRFILNFIAFSPWFVAFRKQMYFFFTNRTVLFFFSMVFVFFWENKYMLFEQNKKKNQNLHLLSKQS